MAVRCPVCKAENSAGPTCRRCKADLTFVFTLEEKREAVLARARWALGQRQYSDAHAKALLAHHLRGDEPSRQLVAITALLLGDHAMAWRFREAITSSSGAP